MLRVFYFTRIPLDYDELIDFSMRFKDLSLERFLSSFIRGDEHLPFSKIFLYLVYSVFGINDFTARLSSTFFYWLSIPILYKLVKDHFDIMSAKISIILFTFSFSILYYAQSSRSYMGYIFLSLLFLSIYMKQMDNNKKTPLLFLSGLILMNMHVGGATLVLMALTLLLLTKRIRGKEIFAFLFFGVLPLIGQIYYFKAFDSIGVEHYLSRVDTNIIMEVTSSAFLNKVHGQTTYVKSLIPFYFFLTLLFLSLLRQKGEKAYSLLIFLIFPILITWSFSKIGFFVLEPKIYIYYLPLIFILISTTLISAKLKRILVYVLLMLCPLHLVYNLDLYQFKPNYSYRSSVHQAKNFFKGLKKQVIISGCEKTDAETLYFYYHYNDTQFKSAPITRICNDKHIKNNHFVKNLKSQDYIVHHFLINETQYPERYFNRKKRLMDDFKKEGFEIVLVKHPHGEWGIEQARKGHYDIEQWFLRKI